MAGRSLGSFVLFFLAACAAEPGDLPSPRVACNGKCDAVTAALNAAPAYATLGETGFFGEDGQINRALTPFTPNYPLWTDGADKRRWILLPTEERATRPTPIGTHDMDQWTFPVGTKVWKQFAAPGGTPIYETRLIERINNTGNYEQDYWIGAFLWGENQDGRAARFVRDGAQDVHGRAHDVPSVSQCAECHNADPSVVLGFSAIQLAGQPFMSDTSFLNEPLGAGISADVPGDATQRAALGYLHGNCGHCHNDTNTPGSDMRLRIGVNLALTDTGPYRTAVNCGDLIKGGDPAMSRVHERLRTGEMPPLGVETPDTTGVAAVAAWIRDIPAGMCGATGGAATPPAQGGACGDVTYLGHCLDTNTAEWCQDGALQTERCDGQGKVCAYIDENVGYYCTEPMESGATTPCGELTYQGRCNGAIAEWCAEGTIQSVNCAANGQTCGLLSAEEGYYCVAASSEAGGGTGCGELTYLGHCRTDTTAEWCENGAPKSVDCAANGQVCGYVDESTGYYCVDP